MENEQPAPNQSLMETQVQPKQASSNNNRLFVAVIIGILLTAIIAGSGVYFWQKSANEETISSMEQKIASLEEQISAMERMRKKEVPPQPTTSPAAGWKEYRSTKQKYSVSYPKGWVLKENVNSNYPGMITISPPTANEGNMYKGSISVWPNYSTTQSLDIKQIAQSIRDAEREVAEYTPGEFWRINNYDYWITEGGCCMDFGKHAFVAHGRSVYRVTLHNLEELFTIDEIAVFNQILSTFKFTD